MLDLAMVRPDGSMPVHAASPEYKPLAFYPVSIGNYWEEAGPPRVPLLTFFGANDQFLGERELEWLAGLDADPEVPMSVHIYRDTGHAFFNDARPELYRAETAADAWLRTLDFLASA